MGTIHGLDTRLGKGWVERSGHTSVPRLVQWMADYRCSYSCPHCLTAQGTGKSLSTREAMLLIDEVASLGVHEFLVTGGEPLEREDLPTLIEHLGLRGQRWSLNTARKPVGDFLRAMRRFPPVFAAVSVDGPQSLHDSFRGRRGAFQEAMQSVTILSELTGTSVAIGTTVTSHNIDYLVQTFAEVLASEATAWGLHLVVPEGRASGHPELTLSPRQVRQLIRFAASKRAAFPVTMADEVGYCGEWEPLVRDEPFYCGAGRAQCVVLPDGEVVACTTIDRSESAGNVRDTPLSSIWKDGFATLRSERLPSTCSTCSYAPVCGAGCWLQRRHGVQCFKQSWQRPSTLRTSAGLAVCFGLSACHPSDPRPPTPVVVLSPTAAPSASTPLVAADAAAMTPTGERRMSRHGIDLLDSMIAQNLFSRRRQSAPEPLAELASRDPGFAYFAALLATPKPTQLAQIAERIRPALSTRQRSILLGGLMWRELSEWCLQGPAPQSRSAAHNQMLRETLTLVASATARWRLEIVESKLDPFLDRQGGMQHFFRSKAGPPQELMGVARASRKHWPGSEQITIEYLQNHPLGEAMQLRLILAPGTAVVRSTPAGRSKMQSGEVMGVFDVIEVYAAKPVPITLQWEKAGLNVTAAAGSELTYADILRLAYEQNRVLLDGELQSPSGQPMPPWMIPALRAKLAALTSSDPQRAETLRTELEDLWMF